MREHLAPLVEEGVISNEKALDAINGVVELTRENDDIGQRRSASRSAAQLIEAIAQTFALKGVDKVTSNRTERRGRPECSRAPDRLGLAAHAYFSEDGAQLGSKGRDLNLEFRRSLTHRFPARSARVSRLSARDKPSCGS